MALTESAMLKLGTEMPEFALIDVTTGKEVSSEDFTAAKGILVMFICQHCPYVQHVAGELAKIGEYYEGSGIKIVAISANDVESYPDDSPANLAEMAQEHEFKFPILYDKDQEVALDFRAACTPDFFLFDKDRKLAYRGQLDDSRPGNNKPLTGKDLREAMDAVLAGKRPRGKQIPSSGCSIKWKAGNEPV